MADGIVAIVTDVGVNMGDHAQDVERAVAVSPTETIQELLNRVIPEGSQWVPRKYDNFVTLRFIEPMKTDII